MTDPSRRTHHRSCLPVRGWQPRRFATVLACGCLAGALTAPSAVATAAPSAGARVGAGPGPRATVGASAATSSLVVAAPRPAPDRISLMPGSDAATQLCITWRTAEATRSGSVQIQRSSGGAVSTVAATSSLQSTTAGYRQRFHTATVTGLTAGTSYRYRVGSGRAWTSWATVRTSAGRLVPHSLLAMGDVQRGISTTWKSVVNRALTDKPSARALLLAGDLVNTSTSEAEWSQVFATVGPLARRMAMLPVVGNHEYAKATSLTPQWRAQFPYPGADLGRRVPTALAGTVWSTDIDGVRHIGLNGYYRIPKTAAGQTDWLKRQGEWLRRTVTTNPQRWTVVTFHYPVWSSTPGRGNPELRKAWLPILESSGVDLVLQGHDHAYVRGQRTRTGTPGGPVGSGPVYVTSSSSSRQYPLSTRDWTTHGAVVARAFAGTPVYLAIDVTHDRLVYRAKDSSGRILDRFTMTKTGTTRTVTNR